MRSKIPLSHCVNAKRRMKPSALCCTRTPALRCRTRPSPVTAAMCWIQPSQRNHAVPRRRRPNHRQPPKGNWQRDHPSVSHGHENRASRLQKIFSEAAQWSADTVCSRRRRATKKTSAMLKSKSRWVQGPRPTHVTQSCNARSSRTDKGKRSHVLLPSELGVAAPARGFTHAVPPRRLPLAASNSRPKQGVK